MAIKNSIKKVLVSLGKSNKPTYAVMAIAVVKGIARPIFTMMDKHEDPETKKYTAVREGLTEVVAVPTYFACGELASKVAGGLKLSPEKQALAKHNFMFMGVCLAALFAIPAITSLTIKPLMKKLQENDKRKKEQSKIDNIIEEVKDELDINEHELDIKEGDDDLAEVTRLKPFEKSEMKQELVKSPSLNYSQPRIGGMKVGAL